MPQNETNFVSILQIEKRVENRILLVDDEPYNLLALTTILVQAEKTLLTKRYGEQIFDKCDSKITHILDTATNGMEALELVR